MVLGLEFKKLMAAFSCVVLSCGTWNSLDRGVSWLSITLDSSGAGGAVVLVPPNKEYKKGAEMTDGEVQASNWRCSVNREAIGINLQQTRVSFGCCFGHCCEEDELVFPRDWLRKFLCVSD